MVHRQTCQRSTQTHKKDGGGVMQDPPPKESELLHRGPVQLSKQWRRSLDSTSHQRKYLEVSREPSPGAGLLNKALLALHITPDDVDTVKRQPQGPQRATSRVPGAKSTINHHTRDSRDQSFLISNSCALWGSGVAVLFPGKGGHSFESKNMQSCRRV